jgi:hypothetical protein
MLVGDGHCTSQNYSTAEVGLGTETNYPSLQPTRARSQEMWRVWGELAEGRLAHTAWIQTCHQTAVYVYFSFI